MYVKLIDDKLELVPKNYDGIINYDLDTERLIQDGWKLLIPIIIPETNRLFHIEYEENSTEIREIIIYDETQEEAEARVKQEEKERKEKEIDLKIEELEKLSVNELLYNNKENIEVYKEVINGLKLTKENL